MRLDSTYDLASLLPDGTRVLPQEDWDDAVTRCCGGQKSVDGDFLINRPGLEWMKRRMLRDVTLGATDRLYRCLVNEGQHAVAGRVEKPGIESTPEDRRRYELSEECLAFSKAWIDALKYSLKSLAQDLLEAKFFGHKLAEIEYQEFSPTEGAFAGQTFIVPVDIAPKPRTAYRFKVTKSNVLVGVVPDGGNDDDVLPAANVLVLTMGGYDRDPRGGGLAPELYGAVESRRKAYVNRAKASDQTGGGYPVVEQDFPPVNSEGTSEFYEPFIEVPDGQDEQGNPKTRQIAREAVTAKVVAAAGTGKAVTLLAGQRIKLLQGSGAEIFGQILKDDNKDIARSYFGSDRMTNEAENGSKADTGVAENVAETVRDADRGILCTVYEELIARVIALNFGPKYKGLEPRYDITTEEGDQFDAVLTAILNPQFKGLPVDVQNFVASKGGFPAVFEEQEEVEVQEEDTNAQEFAIFAGGESRLEIANRAAQKRVDNTVRTADRQFRSLIKRALDGKLTEDEFRERFAFTLSAGHDRAYTVGRSHAGQKQTTQEGETYLAETVTSEADYANGLTEALFGEEPISVGEANRRARMYANRMRGTANEAFRTASQETGFSLTWALGGVEFHCEECPQYSQMSPWEPEELFTTPGEGDTPCLSNCKCSLTRSDGRKGFAPVVFA